MSEQRIDPELPVTITRPLRFWQGMHMVISQASGPGINAATTIPLMQALEQEQAAAIRASLAAQQPRVPPNGEDAAMEARDG